jgi:hypothetical protein
MSVYMAYLFPHRKDVCNRREKKVRVEGGSDCWGKSSHGNYPTVNIKNTPTAKVVPVVPMQKRVHEIEEVEDLANRHRSE